VTGEPWYGLYRIVFFPFVAKKYSPRAKHNSVYLSCYFDSASDPGLLPARSPHLLAAAPSQFFAQGSGVHREH